MTFAPVSPLDYFDASLEAARETNPTEDLTEAQELATVLRHLEHRSGDVPLTDLLGEISRALGTPPPATSPLTAAQEDALRAAGSYVTEMPPAAQRASTMAAKQHSELIATSLTTKDVAQLLSVTPGRISQRVAAKTLYSLRVGNTLRFPRFQFTEAGELPGWKHVCPTLPENVPPISVENLMTRPSPDLTQQGEQLSPAAWLASGGSPDDVVRLVRGAWAHS